MFLSRLRAGVVSRTTGLVWLLASAVATLAGPFGTFATMDAGIRAAFWFGLVGIAMVVGIAIRSAIRTFLPGRTDWGETVIFAPILTLVFTPFLYAVVMWVSAGMNTMSPLAMGLVVFLAPLAVTVFRSIVAGPKPDVLRPAARPEPRILRRLPEASGNRVLRISVRDHYVEIFTDRRKEKVLMRFSDAIAEAEGIPGFQVHRSHWVAEDAVTAVQRENGRMYLTLEDGARVPVSRGFRDVVGARIGKDAA